MKADTTRVAVAGAKRDNQRESMVIEIMAWGFIFGVAYISAATLF